MLRPLKFKPIAISTIWGSEEWILSSLDGRESVLAPQCDECGECGGAERSGTTIRELAEKFGAALLGEKVWNRFGADFPLLVKFITARNQLSVQVHPDDAMAARKGLPNGKTEMWYVLEANNNPELLLGFLKKLDAEEFAGIVRSSIADVNTKDAEQSIENVLNRCIASRGDRYFIPAGTVHSIGAGLKILEIQQSSDTTYRLYDFNRKDKTGNRRKLDVEDAIEAIDFSRSGIGDDVQKNVFREATATVQLAECEYFTAQFINFAKMFGPGQAGSYSLYQFDYSKFDSFSIIVCVGGAGKMYFSTGNSSHESAGIKSGDLYLLPASLGSVTFRSTDGLQLVECHI